MGLPCLFILTSPTHRSKRSAYQDVRYYLRTYLDETGKLRLNSRTEKGSDFSFGDVEAPVVPGAKAPEGLSRVILPLGYVRGQLTAGGFMKDLAVVRGLGRRTGKNALEKSRWIDGISREWSKRLGEHRNYSKVKGLLVRNNFSLSLSLEMTQRLTRSGVPAPAFLERVLDMAFSRYVREHGYAEGDSLGYVHGFHLDTGNLHLQVSVFPRTKLGAVVKVTEMVRSSVKTERFASNMTRYACEAALELEKEYFGRGKLGGQPARVVGQGMFRSERVWASYESQNGKVGAKGMFEELEQDLISGFIAESGCPAELFELLRRMLRRYAGGTREQSAGPVNYGTPEAGSLARRMSRLWFGLAYARQEAGDVRKAGAWGAEDEGRAEEAEGAGASLRKSVPDFPDELLPEYHRFWERALRDVRGKESERLRREMLSYVEKKKNAVSGDIQREIDLDAAGWRPEFLELGEWFEKYLLYLDKYLLLGTGVFFSRMGLQELEMAVKARVATTKFFTKSALGVGGSVEKSGEPEPVVPGIESQVAPSAVEEVRICAKI